MSTTIKLRRTTLAAAPALADGEPLFTTDTHALYVGFGGASYQITGTSLPDPVTPAHGGTGLTSLTAHALVVGAGASSVDLVGPAASGQLLIAQGASADPAFKAMSGDATLDLNGVLTLKNTGPGATGPIGDGTHVSTVTIDAQGRVTALTSTAITGAAPTGAAGGDLGGTYPNPTINTVTPAKGGTGLTTLTAHAVVVGAGTSNVDLVGPGSSGQLLIAQGASADPSFNSLSGDATLSNSGALTLASVGTAGTYGQVTTDAKGRVTAGATCDVSHGGTGLATLTAHAVYVGNGTSAPTALALGATGQVLTSNGAGADPSFQANPGAVWPPRFVAGLNLTYTDATHIVVKAGSAIDSTNAVNMTLASDTTINLGASGLNGVDVLAGSGTATSSSTAVAGTSSNFTTAFGTRALSGTVTNTGTACVGSGTKFLSQVSVNDLIGTAAAGYKQVTAIADDTHLTLLATFTASALAVNCIEQPFFSQSGAVTPARVTAIADDTHLTADRAIGASGVAWASGQYGTGSYPGGAVNTYLIVWLVVQSGTTGVLLSNQRTTPQLASVTSYRRIGEVELDTIGNIIRFTQRGDGLLREMQLEIAQVTNNNRILSAGTATTFTTVVASGIVPPTATDLFLALTAINSANAEDMYVRPRNSGSSAVTSDRYLVTPAANQYGSLFLLCPCDGAQAVEYIHSIANGTGYLDCLGWRSLL